MLGGFILISSSRSWREVGDYGVAIRIENDKRRDSRHQMAHARMGTSVPVIRSEVKFQQSKGNNTIADAHPSV